MLIINADDLGRNYEATNHTLACYKKGLISSASLMVFMADSQRAAELATEVGLETGLHLNLDQPFGGHLLSPRLLEYHRQIIRYFRIGQLALLLYNPLLKNKLDYIFKAQYNEFCRLFSIAPRKIDGHHHLHLCMNILKDRLIPDGLGVRRNFTFERGEKNVFNRAYRRMIDTWLVRRYLCTDSFFSLREMLDPNRLKKIISLAYSSNIEIMVHPEYREEYEFLNSPQYRDLLEGVPIGTYLMLSQRAKKEITSVKL
jgi:predicted glycoside hydrolase/deacetylase ChbG (UPF0249 family)